MTKIRFRKFNNAEFFVNLDDVANYLQEKSKIKKDVNWELKKELYKIKYEDFKRGEDEISLHKIFITSPDDEVPNTIYVIAHFINWLVPHVNIQSSLNISNEIITNLCANQIDNIRQYGTVAHLKEHNFLDFILEEWR